MKTSELTGKALDWAVARLESQASPTGMDSADILLYRSTATNAFMYKRWAIPYSTDWAQGGPIIEREKMDIACWDAHSMPWKASIDGDTDAGVALYVEYGPTPLIAAMRCYVASKLGDDINIPEELK
jgi:hypothetical protein